MKKKTALIGCLIIAASTIIGGSFYKILDVKHKGEVVADVSEEAENVITYDAGMQPNVVERVISSSQLWRPVQDRVRDTVAQIFVHIIDPNLILPYAPPGQAASSGSAFFINDQGYLITNAHVVANGQAKMIYVQVPSLGKQIIDAEIIGISPDRDLALLKLSDEGVELLRKELGGIPYLPLGNSDLVRRSDDVLALGYPLGQQSLKSTTGVVSGREDGLIQVSAPINPGSSGGPTLNTRGEVIGINSSGITEAQNVGYAIPINDLKVVLNDLQKVKLLRRPFLGVLFNNANEALREYLGNPAPGGCYVVEVVPKSPLDKIGIKTGDMIYEINGHAIDMYGEMELPFSEGKQSIINYVSRLKLGDEIHLVAYRNGVRKEFDFTLSLPEKPAIHEIYPGYEELDHEVFAGMVVTPLTLNHLPILAKQAPGLTKYVETKYQADPTLVITHIFPNSQLYRSRSLPVGSTINEINGIQVRTLDEFRQAVKQSEATGYFTIRASDNVTRKSENLLVVLPWKKVLQEEPKLAADFRYPLTKMAQNMLQSHILHQSLEKKQLVPNVNPVASPITLASNA